ncbi:hypothetical protein [Micromonospora maritima]|uniref:hypothetical protein n=1 Tax=Micromonospora maritima TaxID=986711 RepID=UPI00157CCFD8|nr:hypothetical protein [Micromonospora maritima]
MDIITYCIEERIVDARTAPDCEGLMNVDLTAKPIHTAEGTDGGWRVLRAAIRTNPDRYRSGSGFRLVLVAQGGDR